MRAAYFALLDEAVNKSGNSKKDLHEYWKGQIFPFLFENPDNFVEESRQQEYPPYSTKSLTEAGWKTFYEEFRHFCHTNFNI